MSKFFDPDRSLGVLINDVARALRRNFDRRLQSLGLTQAQWRALVHVERMEGLNQVALAECLESQPITVARLIDRMENAGWIERRADPLDRRAVQLYLTPKSQPILEEIHARAVEMTDDVVAGLSPTAQKQLFNHLLRMKQNLAAAEPKALAANESLTRTNRDVKRKAPRVQHAR